MEIKKTQAGGTDVLALIGRLDTTTAPKLQKLLMKVISEAAAVELDFAEVDYVSSAGLRVLLIGQKSAQSSGKTMSLKHVSSDVMEVFDMTGFTALFHFE